MTRRRVLTFGLLTGVLASGYGVIFTVLDDYRDEYGISGSWLGAIVGIGFFSAFGAQVAIAPVADRGHARRIVYVGLALAVVGLTMIAFGESVPPLLIGRFVMGLGMGTAFPAIRRIVVVADPDNLGQNLGLLLSADVAGFAAGPALSALLVGPFGLAAPFLVIVALTIACAPVVARVEVDEAEVGDAPVERFAFDLFRSRQFVAAACMGSAVFLMIGTFDAMWAVVLDDLDSSEWLSNLGITIFALPLIVLGSVGGRLAQRVGPFRLGVVGLVIGAGFLAMYGVWNSGEAMVGAGALHALSDGLTMASTGVATGMVVARSRQASAQGMVGAVETLTAAITAVSAGVLYDQFGRQVAYGAAASVMMILALVAWTLAGVDGRARRGPTGGTVGQAVAVPESAY